MEIKTTDAIGVLKQVAHTHAGRVSRCNGFDCNIITRWVPTPDRPGYIQPLSGEVLERKTNFRCTNYAFKLAASETSLRIQVGYSDLIEGFAFSVNRPCRVLLFDRPCLEVAPKGWKVFVSDRIPAKAISDWFKKPRHIQVLSGLNLGENDMLAVYRNCTSIYLHKPTALEVEDAMPVLALLVESFPLDITSISPPTLPTQFHTLQSLSERWASSDDTNRVEQLAKANTKTLECLIRSVFPHLDAINAYLDSFNQTPLPEEAIALQCLAECACEAKLLLEKRILLRKQK